MALTTPVIGSIVRGTSTLTPVAPRDNAGDTILLFTGVGIGTNTLSTPAGWTLMSHDANAKQVKCFGLDSVGSTTIPGILWSGAPVAWAVVVALSGCALVASAVDASNDRASNTTSSIVGPASSFLPTANNEIVFFFGERNKTSTSNSSVYTPPTNFTTLLSDVPTGTNPVAEIAYWLQTTAASVPANSSFSGSIADGTTQSNQGSMFALKPASVSVVVPSRSLLGVGV